jgi:Tfp pilus assembly protein PilN
MPKMLWFDNFSNRVRGTKTNDMSTPNLLPKREREKRQQFLRNYYTLLIGAILLAGLLVVTAILLLFDQVYRLNLQSAQAERAQAQSEAALYLNTEKDAQALSKELDTLKKAQSQTTHWSTLLSDLQRVTPAGVAVEKIDIQPPQAGNTQGGGTRASITGSADSRRSVAEFQIGLAATPAFKNVEMEATTQSGVAVQYKISFEVNYDKLEGAKK